MEYIWSGASMEEQPITVIILGRADGARSAETAE